MGKEVIIMEFLNEKNMIVDGVEYLGLDDAGRPDAVDVE